MIAVTSCYRAPKTQSLPFFPQYPSSNRRRVATSGSSSPLSNDFRSLPRLSDYPLSNAIPNLSSLHHSKQMAPRSGPHGARLPKLSAQEGAESARMNLSRARSQHRCRLRDSAQSGARWRTPGHYHRSRATGIDRLGKIVRKCAGDRLLRLRFRYRGFP